MSEKPTPLTDAYPTALVERSIHEALNPQGMSTHSGKVQLDCSHVLRILDRSRRLERALAVAEEHLSRIANFTTGYADVAGIVNIRARAALAQIEELRK